MKTIFQSLNPSDSKVFINYKNKKNPVSFEYPNKSSAFKVVFSSFFNILLHVFLIMIVPFFIISILLQAYKINNNLINLILTVFLPSFLGISLLLLFLFSLCIVCNKKLLKKMPKINHFLAKIYSPSHQYVYIRKLKEKIFVIPLFENIYMEYILSGDFKKYIKTFKIIEYDFYYRKRNLITRRLSKRKQLSDWFAKFEFSRIPQSGTLKIEFI